MPTNDRGGLKAAFTNFNRPDADKAAELRLLGRTVDSAPAEGTPEPSEVPESYHSATMQATPSGLNPRPLLQREVVRQLSFRCPLSLAADLRRKSVFNQLEQQQIIIEGIKRVLTELPEPPADWRE
jgi:hypothetical protein